ncbi:MAG: hypothetical protein ABGX47_08185 [Martelella sp.]|uniref:hypothetical protein n=1 Tax=Martelella sp. TaxID=1969699 RepID=UPI003241E3F0
MRHCLAVMVAGLVLSACSFFHDDSAPTVKMVPVPVEVPDSARLACTPLLSDLPETGGLSEQQVVDKWGRDRTAVTICDRRRAGAIAAIDAANALAKTQEEQNGDWHEP